MAGRYISYIPCVLLLLLLLLLPIVIVIFFLKKRGGEEGERTISDVEVWPGCRGVDVFLYKEN